MQSINHSITPLNPLNHDVYLYFLAPSSCLSLFSLSIAFINLNLVANGLAAQQRPCARGKAAAYVARAKVKRTTSLARSRQTCSRR